jgi:HAD superfamily hydrolase (TIGR01484 family)
MKVLYISDLDGTLLNREAELSEYTARHLNELIENGVHISVATARTAATCERILKDVHFNTPIILMNGVLIYDIRRKFYVKKGKKRNRYKRYIT